MATETELTIQRDANRATFLSELREELNNKGIGKGFELEDNFLIKFLRANAYDVNDARNSVKQYLLVVEKYPHFFDGFEFGRKAMENGVFRIFPHRNENGERILNCRMGNWEPDEFSYASIAGATLFGLETAVLDDETQLNGCVQIMDMDGFRRKKFIKVGMAGNRISNDFNPHAFPIRVRKIFVCNESQVMDVLYSMMRPFVGSDVRQKFEFIGTDFSKLHQEIPVHLLPEKYGGTWKEDSDTSAFVEQMKSFEPDVHKVWQPFNVRVKN